MLRLSPLHDGFRLGDRYDRQHSDENENQGEEESEAVEEESQDE